VARLCGLEPVPFEDTTPNWTVQGKKPEASVAGWQDDASIEAWRDAGYADGLDLEVVTQVHPLQLQNPHTPKPGTLKPGTPKIQAPNQRVPPILPFYPTPPCPDTPTYPIMGLELEAVSQVLHHSPERRFLCIRIPLHVRANGFDECAM